MPHPRNSSTCVHCWLAYQGGFSEVLTNRAEFGKALAPLDDMDGDGVDEMAVGAWRFGKGSVWVLFLNVDGTVNSEQQIADNQVWCCSPMIATTIGENVTTRATGGSLSPALCATGRLHRRISTWCQVWLLIGVSGRPGRGWGSRVGGGSV